MVNDEEIMAEDAAEVELEKIIGITAMRFYDAAPKYAKPNLRRWAGEMVAMGDEDFVIECEARILDSARASGRKGNWSADHCMADACAEEAERRHLAAGHDEECRGDNLYEIGYRNAYISQDHRPPEVKPCDCGREG